jgi:predicted kinase
MDRLLVVVFGLMGVGKTTVARALGQARGWPVIHSDVVRKSLAGLAPTTPARFEFGHGIYSEDLSQKTYTEMRRRAGELLDGGANQVILDASFKSAGERARVRELAREKEARVVFVFCNCPKELVRERLRQRADNTSAISDGRLELLDLQMEDFEALTEEDQPLLRLDTGRDLEKVLQEVDGFIEGLLVR